MLDSKLEEILSECTEEGHFVLASGLHTQKYLNLDSALCSPLFLLKAAECIVERLGDCSWVTAVIGPPTGGQVLAQAVAIHLTNITQKEVLFLFASKSSNGGFKFPPSIANKLKGQQCLVVEDVATTLGSARVMCNIATEHGAECRAFAAFYFRKNLEEVNCSFVQQFTWVRHELIEAWPKETCPVCNKLA